MKSCFVIGLACAALAWCAMAQDPAPAPGPAPEQDSAPAPETPPEPEATPAPEPTPEPISEIEAAFQVLPSYTIGGDHKGLELIRVEANRVQGDPAAREALAARLVAVIEDECTPDAQLFVCRQLYIIGGAESVPALAKLLAVPETADEARYALERMEAPEAGVALRTALEQLQGQARVGVINSVGIRRDSEAVPALAVIAAEEDEDAAAAAVEALTLIGDGAACDAIQARLDDPREARKRAAEDGVLACAEQKLAAGATADAARVFESLFNSKRRDAVRVAAFRGLVLSRPDDTAAMVNAALTGNDEPVALAALRFVREAEDPTLTPQFAGWLPKLPPDRAAQLLFALSDRGDPAALPAIISLVRHDPREDVAVSALSALGVLGDKTAIPVLARSAAEGPAEIAQAAEDSLARLKGDEIDHVMMTAARAGADSTAKVLITALGERKASDVAPEMIAKFAKSDGKPEMRQESLRALAKIADPDQLDDLVAVLDTADNDDVRAEAERAIVATAARAQGSKKTADVLDGLRTADQVKSRAALISALGKIGDPSGLDAVRGAMRDPEAEVRSAAVTALAEWSDEAVMADLAALAQTAEAEAWRETAFNGYVRFIRENKARDAAATVELYRHALQVATTPAQLRMVFAGLAEVPDVQAAELAKPYLENPDVAAEARIAYDRIRRSLFAATASHKPEDAVKALDNDPRSGWSTGTIQTPGQWFQVDMNAPASIKRLVLDTSAAASDFPRAYEVYVSNDPENWSTPIVIGQGIDPVTAIDIPNVEGRYIRIVQTGSSTGNFWSIQELLVETN